MDTLLGMSTAADVLRPHDLGARSSILICNAFCNRNISLPRLEDNIWTLRPRTVDITIIGRTALRCPILHYRLRDQLWFRSLNVLIDKLD